MSNKNEVFEYLIDQLRQQVNKKDVTSFNVSVQISDLDDVKQVIHNLQQHIAGKDDEIRALKDRLRQQEGNNPYKQQCEDLAHEVLSLKNQLRDASAQIKELHKALAGATGDAEAYKLICKGAYGPEQSGCRKEDTQGWPYSYCYVVTDGCRKDDTQECDHNWIIAPGLFIAEGHKDNVPGSRFCCECGAREWDDKEYVPKAGAQECEHDWRVVQYSAGVETNKCRLCGVEKEVRYK